MSPMKLDCLVVCWVHPPVLIHSSIIWRVWRVCLPVGPMLINVDGSPACRVHSYIIKSLNTGPWLGRPSGCMASCGPWREHQLVGSMTLNESLGRNPLEAWMVLWMERHGCWQRWGNQICRPLSADKHIVVVRRWVGRCRWGLWYITISKE